MLGIIDQTVIRNPQPMPLTDESDNKTPNLAPHFVFAYTLDGKGGCADITAQTDATAHQWVHLDYSERSAPQSLASLGLDHGLIESLTRSDTRPRTIVMEEGILVSLRAVNVNPGAVPEDMVSLRLWIEPTRLITVRQRRLFSVQDARESLLEGSGPKDISGLVVQIIENLADRVAEFVDVLQDRVVAFEEDAETSRLAGVRSRVAALRRQTATVRRYLAPQREALEVLLRQALQVMDEDHAHTIREQSDRIVRYVEDLDLVREQALVLQEELLNSIMEQQNARMYVLAIISVIFLPITFLTGVFGMNVAGLPGTESPSAFWVVAGVTLSSVTFTVVLLKRKRWF